ncbi:hypothetical protein HNY42_15720 (plasmid) [Exiguobacterium sp. Helios]|nr:hypothetical protein [Exiguobacterium sp. Helios]QNR22539.1 hypothetical protein HNY42_15720 [Exiguobacterium sp. Helios]
MTTKDNTPTLGVIIPCYNEKDVLQLTIEALCRFFEEWQAKKNHDDKR